MKKAREVSSAELSSWRHVSALKALRLWLLGGLLGALSLCISLCISWALWWAQPKGLSAQLMGEMSARPKRAVSLEALSPLPLSTPRALSAPPLKELSGLAQSALNSEVFWAHNDSLDQPRLFALNARGELLAERAVKGAHNIDWEDITTPTGELQGLIFVLDAGNNFHWRDELLVYVLREPTELEGDQPIEVIARLPFTHPTTARALMGRPPLELTERCLDSEAMFWAEGSLYLIGKCLWGGEAPLFELPLSLSERAALKDALRAPSRPPLSLPKRPLKLTQTLSLGPASPPWGWRVTGADYHASTRSLAVLCYLGVWRFSWRPSHAEGPAVRGQGWRFSERSAKQVEALAWRRSREGEASLLLANEQRELFEVRLPPEPLLEQPLFKREGAQ